MTTAIANRQYTPEDLLAMPDGKDYELVRGQLVERNTRWESSLVAGRLFRRLSNHCEAHRLGHVLPADAGYMCFPKAPGKVRRPDVSFVSFERLAPENIPRGHCLIPPDLAVEVVSPHDRFNVLIEKANELLSVGVRQVWVVSPPNRWILVLRADGTVAPLHERDELTGEDVVPGFRCPVAELFADLPSPDRVADEVAADEI